MGMHLPSNIMHQDNQAEVMNILLYLMDVFKSSYCSNEYSNMV